MTAFASNLLAALPGVGVKQDAGGATTGQATGASMGMGAAFGAMLDALMGDTAAIVEAGGKTGSTVSRLSPEQEELTDQGAVEALLAGLLVQPFAPQTPAVQATTPRGEGQPLGATAANVVAAAVDAAVDAALPAPAEAAVDTAAAVISVLADALSKDAVAPGPDTVASPTATVAADRASGVAAAEAGSEDGLLAARADLPSVNGDKTVAGTAGPDVIDLQAAAPAPALAAPDRADVAVPPVASPVQSAATPSVASPAVNQAALPEATRAILQATGATVSARTVKAEAPVQAAAAPQPVAEDPEAVAVTASAIADAAVETAEAPPVAAQAAAASAAAPLAGKSVAPVESRRATRLAEARSALESGETSGARIEKTAAKADGAAPSPVQAAADETPDAQLAPVDVADAAPQSASEGQVAEPGVSSAATRHAEAAPIVRGSPETVARLAADIAHKLSSQNTKFDIQLDPLGLGKVDVSVEINADGRLTAALSFDSAAAAADLKGRSAELRQALQQAGFDVSENGLSFDMAGQNSGFGGGRQAGDQPGGWSSRAFQSVQTGLEDADARLTAALSNRSRTPSGGVDIRI